MRVIQNVKNILNKRSGAGKKKKKEKRKNLIPIMIPK